MKTGYKIEIIDKSINTTSVKVIIEEKTFKQMWDETDKKIKNSIKRCKESYLEFMRTSNI